MSRRVSEASVSVLNDYIFVISLFGHFAMAMKREHANEAINFVDCHDGQYDRPNEAFDEQKNEGLRST